eukprot:CAMPEP_0198725766 /NCGR_PEP_ID=MMETSP1475-20131203/3017_1 /TAXON_ID= ORGANISM="Unidentified sp., Strain CCMP1999" /NCGR_SAMPLE_ID=MMETSP1475 /ASSEMBLY_ACC=CAM_ASM_001111 /LENGTH=206 /DNA_ID=CAMNT_0044487599 /DNA_START=46 /DNA_END=666 /DNA_ORIENTATION=+
MTGKKALVIVDLQYDFLPGGSLGVSDGDQAISGINRIRNSPHFDVVVFTRDWHPADHISFARNHPGKKEFEDTEINGFPQTLWPVHCVQNTHGAEIHCDVVVKKSDLIHDKGGKANLEEYSAFGNANFQIFNGFNEKLKSLGVDTIYICGLATDFCVGNTALDARHFGLKTYLLTDLVRGISDKLSRDMMERMSDRGVHLISSANI